MEFVQLNLEEMLAPKLTGQVFVHEGQFVIFNKKKLWLQAELEKFNFRHETTKFILKSSNENLPKSEIQTSLQVIQLGQEQPCWREVVIFLVNLGLEVVSGAYRSYSTADLTVFPETESDGLSLFLNEIFCLNGTKDDAYFDLYELGYDHQKLLKALGITIKAFQAVKFNESGRYQYLQLIEPQANRVHTFKACYWQEERDGSVHYATSERIDARQFEKEREHHTQILTRLLKEVQGTESITDLLLPF